jgi:hypothetical protein
MNASTPAPIFCYPLDKAFLIIYEQTPHHMAEPNQQTVLSNDPFVATYSDVLSPEECTHFIELAKPKLKRALVSSGTCGFVSAGRTGQNTWLKHDTDAVTRRVAERIAALAGMPLENAEKFQVIYYGPTDEYRTHYDSWEHDGSEKTLRCMKHGGARVKTALCYLNTVERGGGTRMTKLGVDVAAERGKLLVFANTLGADDHARHPLSEHAGMPVEAGEKYAFNLWFRECRSTRLYRDFNPAYYAACAEHQGKTFRTHPTLFDAATTLSVLLESSRNGWVKLADAPSLVDAVERATGLEREFYEGIRLVEYSCEKPITNFVAYDLKSESGRQHTQKRGQRMFTVSLFLTNHFELRFPRMSETAPHAPSAGDCVCYKNTVGEGQDRDDELERRLVCKKGNGYLAEIYVRRNSGLDSQRLLKAECTEPEPEPEPKDTLAAVLNLFTAGKVDRSWKGLGSLSYVFKGDFHYFEGCVRKYDAIRRAAGRGGCLNQRNLEAVYQWDEERPIAVIDDVLCPPALALVQEYYRKTISENVWALGDRQSNRFKAHNEPLSRLLHFECLPLIERAVGKPLRPTYTYLSAYVQGADLPPHTDRADCEFTVSLLVDKPVGSSWNIYVHLPRQPVKHAGRCDTTPPLDECAAVDCGAGGLMLFQGTDHVHFRRTLTDSHYTVLLLHYCSA